MSLEEISEIAPDVIPEAEKNERRINPYISFLELEEICKGDEDLEQLLDQVILYSLKYTETVCRFEQIAKNQKDDTEARNNIENLRKNTHDATIDAINILARNMSDKGKDNSWISKVKINGRPGYMRFAILLAFEYVLEC
jgi:hypothetical protein